MKVYRPLRDNVLVIVTKDKTTNSGIVLPDAPTSRWSRLKVIAVGPEANLKLKSGQTVLAENMVEPIKTEMEDDKMGIILSKYIHVIEEENMRHES